MHKSCKDSKVRRGNTLQRPHTLACSLAEDWLAAMLKLAISFAKPLKSNVCFVLSVEHALRGLSKMWSNCSAHKSQLGSSQSSSCCYPAHQSLSSRILLVPSFRRSASSSHNSQLPVGGASHPGRGRASATGSLAGARCHGLHPVLKALTPQRAALRHCTCPFMSVIVMAQIAICECSRNNHQCNVYLQQACLVFWTFHNGTL